MTEVTIKIPEDIKEIIGETNTTIYVEAIKEIAHKKMLLARKRLKEIKKKIAAYETRHGKIYKEFTQNVPYTMKGHDDWIEWSYLVKVTSELSQRIEKLKLLNFRTCRRT